MTHTFRTASTEHQIGLTVAPDGWCWWLKPVGMLNGPFPTQDAAVDDARGVIMGHVFQQHRAYLV